MEPSAHVVQRRACSKGLDGHNKQLDRSALAVRRLAIDHTHIWCLAILGHANVAARGGGGGLTQQQRGGHARSRKVRREERPERAAAEHVDATCCSHRSSDVAVTTPTLNRFGNGRPHVDMR